MRELTHLDLFSGIGGFALASRWAGFKTIGFCEREPFCQSVLKKHYPDVPIHEDIKTFDGRKFRGVTLLTGGFPCQPFSQAGKRRGKEDDRYLWPEMLRIIKECRPTWVLGENVAGIVKLALDQVLADLEDEGYSTRAFVIPACAVNAPHRRDRVWIVAKTRYSHERGASDGFSQESFNGSASIIRTKTGNRFTDKDCNASDSESVRLQRRKRSLLENGTKPDDKFLHGCCGSWHESWPEVATRLCRVDDGLPNRVDRIKALGNAIVPQVAYQIIKGIREVMG